MLIDTENSKEIKKLKKISFEDFRVIYKNYYKLVVDILVKNNVPFSCACGTMLGAIRDGDMIEWDYDIDNFFFIDDVDKLLSIESQLPPNLHFETYKDGTLRYGIVRIICEDLFRHDKKSKRYLNVWIDFFAIRNVKIKEKKRKRMYEHVLKEEAKISFKNTKYKSKNIFKQIARQTYKFFLPSFKHSSRKIRRKVTRMKDGSTCIMCRNCRLVSLTPIIRDEVTYVKFSGYLIPCYTNYEHILKSLFGETWPKPIVFSDRIIPEFYKK